MIEVDNNIIEEQKWDDSLQNGDQIIIKFHEHILAYSQSSTSLLAITKTHQLYPLQSIFVVQRTEELISTRQKQRQSFLHYGQKIYLRHLVSQNYLVYYPRFGHDDLHFSHQNSSNSIFTLKPMNNKNQQRREIRLRQKIKIQNIQKQNMCINFAMRNQDQAECKIQWNTHKSSSIFFQKVGRGYKLHQELGTFSVYTLKNIQESSQLSLEIKINEQSKVCFSHNINKYRSYLLIQNPVEKQSGKESIINFGRSFVLRFYSNKLYLGFDEEGEIKLYDKTCENCSFIFQGYNCSALTSLSIIKIKHQKSNCYLSVSKSSVFLSRQFNLVNTFTIKRIQYSKVRINCAINRSHERLSSLFKQRNLLIHKKQLRGVINELIYLIFGSSFRYQDYFLMQTTFEQLSYYQQHLLAQIGFLELILNKISDLLENTYRLPYEMKRFYHEVIASSMMIVVGMCQGNSKNGQKFVGRMGIIFQEAFRVPGLIQALFYLCYDQKIVEQLEKYQYKFNFKILQSPIQHSIKQIDQLQNMKMSFKLKVMTLMERLTISAQGQKYSFHEQKLIQSLKSGKLNGLFVEIKLMDDQIYVFLNEEWIQLGDIFQKKSKYSDHIILLKKQLQFLCSLFQKTTQSDIQYFRTLISEEVALKYINMKIPSDDKLVFLNIIEQVYLDSLPRRHTNLVSCSIDFDIQFQEAHSPLLNTIKHQICDAVRHILVDQLYDESLYLYIRICRQLYQLDSFKLEEWCQLHNWLQTYLLKDLEQVLHMRSFINLAEEVLSFYLCTQEFITFNLSRTIIQNLLKENKDTTQNCSENEGEIILKNCLSNKQSDKISQIKFDFVSRLMEYSMGENRQMFQASCKTMQQINDYPFKLISKLKDVIFVDDQQTSDLVTAINNTHQQITKLLKDYQKSINSGQKMGLRHQIVKSITQLNSYFFQRNYNSKGSICPLIQNIMRELSIFHSFSKFIQTQNKEKDNNHCIMKIICQFMTLFISHNETNLILLVNHFKSIKWIFGIEDFGQAKLLYQIISNQNSSSNLKQSIILFCFNTIKKSTTPSFYSVACLIKLIIIDGKISEGSAETIQKIIFEEPDIIDNIWRINQNQFIDQQQKHEQEHFCEYFHLYLFCVIKLFLLIGQYGLRDHQLPQILKKKIKIPLLLDILLQRDIFQDNNFQSLGTMLLKEQVIIFYNHFYDRKYSQLDEKETVYIKNLSSAFLVRLLGYQYIQQPQQSYLKMSQFSVYSYYFQSINIKNNCQKRYNRQAIHLHFLIVGIFLPFALQLSQKCSTLLNLPYIYEQFQSLYYKSGRKIKEFMLIEDGKKQYQNNRFAYGRAFDQIQKITTLKLNIDRSQNLSIICRRQSVNKSDEEMYRNNKLHNLIDNMLAIQEQDSKIAVRSYRQILKLVYSPRVRQILKETKRSINLPSLPHLLQKVTKVVGQLAESKKIETKEGFSIMLMFFESHPGLLDFTVESCPQSFARVIYNLFQCQKQQPSSQSLSLFTLLLNLMMKNIVQSDKLLKSTVMTASLFSRNSESQNPRGKLLMSRIEEELLKEKQLYDKRDYLGQTDLYISRNSLLNFEAHSTNLGIQEFYNFYIYQLTLVPSGISPVDESQIKRILQLTRSYLKFLMHFNMQYIPKQVFNKLILCLKIVKLYIQSQPIKAIKLISESHFHKELILILDLDDTFDTCKDSLLQTEEQYLRGLTYSVQNSDWLLMLTKICQKSQYFYGRTITYQWGKFPLQNMRTLYDPLKRSAILVLKQLQTFNNQQGNQVLLRIPDSTIQRNITIIYYKFFELFKTYDARQRPDYSDQRLKSIADSLCFQNGVDLTSLKMYCEGLRGQKRLQKKYTRYWQLRNKERSHPILQMHHKNDDHDNKISQIYIFFLSKMGRVELLDNGKLLSVNFWIKPECFMSEQLKKRKFKYISFTSTQLKIDSIRQNCIKFHTIFTAYRHFMKDYLSGRTLIFMEKYLVVIKVLNLILIYAATVVLLTETVSKKDQLSINNRLFEILLSINLVLALSYFLVYCFKNAPVFQGKLYDTMRKAQIQTLSGWKRTFYQLRYLLSHKQFVYNVIFLIVMALSLVQKMMIALLAFDILIQLPQMDIIFKTVWRSKTEITFTVISFFIFSYYYSFIVYSLFIRESDRLAYICPSLGMCYYTITALNFRFTGGFPGYLYHEQHNSGFAKTFRPSDFFADIYLILFFLVLPALIFAILLNKLAKITLQRAQKRNKIKIDCVICGLSRIVFNSSSKYSFRTHVSAQHNLEHYYYYYHYLADKKDEERSSIEQRILLDKNCDWLPTDFARGFREPNKLEQ